MYQSNDYLGASINDVHKLMGFFVPLTTSVRILNMLDSWLSANLDLPPSIWTSHMEAPFVRFKMDSMDLALIEEMSTKGGPKHKQISLL